MIITTRQPLADDTRYPSTWRRESREWAEDRKLTADEVAEIENKLVNFRLMRDELQQQRRIQVYPLLKARRNALKGQIEALRLLADWMGELETKGLAWKEFQTAQTHNHRREGLLSAAVEISREYVEYYGQVAIIEADWDAQIKRGDAVPDVYRETAFAGKRVAA